MRALLPSVGTGLRRLRRGPGGDEGTASIEFAIVAVLLLTFLFGIVAYGIQFASRLAITQAASEGARASVAGVTNAERTTFATDAARVVLERYGGLVNVANTTVTAAPLAGDAARFRVTITHDLSRYGLTRLVSFLPMPSDIATVSVVVTNGGL